MKTKTTQWEGGGTYCEGECDVPDCHKSPNWRNWHKDSCGMNGDDECIASLCNEHKKYKQYNTSSKIIEIYNKELLNLPK